MNNLRLQSTIIHPLYDLQLKGGFEDAYKPTSFDGELRASGKRLLDNSAMLEKDLSMEQQNMDIKTFIPVGGFHPVTLIHRGNAMLDKAYGRKHPLLTNLQVRKRPRYTLNTDIIKNVDNVFQEHVAPRLSLLDSEQVAYNQLMQQSQVVPTLMQLPMTDAAADRAYNMLDSVDKQTGVLQPKIGTRFQQLQDPNQQMNTEPQPQMDLGRGGQIAPISAQAAAIPQFAVPRVIVPRLAPTVADVEMADEDDDIFKDAFDFSVPDPKNPKPVGKLKKAVGFVKDVYNWARGRSGPSDMLEEEEIKQRASSEDPYKKKAQVVDDANNEHYPAMLSAQALAALQSAGKVKLSYDEKDTLPKSVLNQFTKLRLAPDAISKYYYITGQHKAKYLESKEYFDEMFDNLMGIKWDGHPLDVFGFVSRNPSAIDIQMMTRFKLYKESVEPNYGEMGAMGTNVVTGTGEDIKMGTIKPGDSAGGFMDGDLDIGWGTGVDAKGLQQLVEMASKPALALDNVPFDEEDEQTVLINKKPLALTAAEADKDLDNKNVLGAKMEQAIDSKNEEEKKNDQPLIQIDTSSGNTTDRRGRGMDTRATARDHSVKTRQDQVRYSVDRTEDEIDAILKDLPTNLKVKKDVISDEIRSKIPEITKKFNELTSKMNTEEYRAMTMAFDSAGTKHPYNAVNALLRMGVPALIVAYFGVMRQRGTVINAGLKMGALTEIL